MGPHAFEFRYPRLKAKPIRRERGLSDIDTFWTEIQAAYDGKGLGHEGARKPSFSAFAAVP